MTHSQTIDLKQGPLLLRALVSGPENGPVALLVHGFPDTPHSWDAVVEGLVRAGYRVVRPWLRGYTPESVHLGAQYDALTAGLDLLAWRDQFPGQPVHLVGHDWGAVAGMAAVATNAAAWKTLSLLAIPPFQKVERAWRLLPRQLSMSAYMLEMQSTKAPAKVMFDDCARLRELWTQWSPGWAFTDADFDPVRHAFSDVRVAWAATRYYRALFTVHRASTRSMYALSRQKLNVPVLAMVGIRDGCMQAGLLQAMVEPSCFPKGIRVELLDNCGHFLQAEQPDAVLNELLQHLT